MKLHDAKVSPNSRRVRFFMAEKGIRIPTEECWDPESNGLDAGFLARWPHRLVPMLELDDGTRIGESTAICRYLEALYPEPNLLGRGAVGQALVEMWQQRVNCDGQIGVEEAFRNAYPPFAGRGLAGTEETVDQIPALVARGRARFARFARMLDRQLASHAFIAGGQFSLADISALCAMDFGKVVGCEAPSELSHLGRWYSEVSGRPSAQA